jgi:hypothetical protein
MHEDKNTQSIIVFKDSISRLPSVWLKALSTTGYSPTSNHTHRSFNSHNVTIATSTDIELWNALIQPHVENAVDNMGRTPVLPLKLSVVTVATITKLGATTALLGMQKKPSYLSCAKLTNALLIHSFFLELDTPFSVYKLLKAAQEFNYLRTILIAKRGNSQYQRDVWI